MARAIAVARQMELMGTTNEPGLYGKETKEFQSELDQISDTIAKVRAKCSRGYRVEQSGPDSWLRWYGVICSLEKPFTLYGINTVGDTHPTFDTDFKPSSAVAGFATQELTVEYVGCTVHFVENGPYTVNEKGPGQFEIIWNATTNHVESSCGVGEQLDPEQISFPLQPLETTECGTP
jgi:hypothetical protein